MEPYRSAAKTGSLRYDVSTRDFAIASELVANHCLETQVSHTDQDFSTRGRTFSIHMDQAIEVLRKGDLECRVRAAELSKRLVIWLKSYCPGEKAPNRETCRRPKGTLRGSMGRPEKQRTRYCLKSAKRQFIQWTNFLARKRPSQTTGGTADNRRRTCMPYNWSGEILNLRIQT